MSRWERAAAAVAEAAAASGGYQYRRLVINPPLSGLLFSNTKEVVLKHVVDARGSDTPFVLGWYHVRRRRARYAKILMIALPRPVPNMVLMSVGNGVLRDAGVAVGEEQHLALEGDFENTFSLYCPREYEADALYIFTPDVMARLVDAVAGCDVEFVDNRVLIYAPTTAFATERAVAQLPELVRFLDEKFHRQTRRYQDDRAEQAVAADPFRRAQITALGGDGADFQIGLRGWRLRTRMNAWQKLGAACAGLLALAAGAYWLWAVLRAFVPSS